MAVKLYGAELREFPTIATSTDSTSFKGKGKSYLKINRIDERIWLTSSGFVIHEVMFTDSKGTKTWNIQAKYPCELIHTIERDYMKFFGDKLKEASQSPQSPALNNQDLSLDRNK